MGDDKFSPGEEFPAAERVEIGDYGGLPQGCEAAVGEDLRYFFIQWVESNGAPEFKLEYTIFRTQKGLPGAGKNLAGSGYVPDAGRFGIETEGNPEEKRVEVLGTSSEFSVDTFGKPKKVIIDPGNKVLRMSPQMRVPVAIRQGRAVCEIANSGKR